MSKLIVLIVFPKFPKPGYCFWGWAYGFVKNRKRNRIGKENERTRKGGKRKEEERTEEERKRK